MKISFWLKDKEHKMDIKELSGQDSVQVALNGKSYRVGVEYLCPDELLLNIDGKVYDVFINANSRSYSVGVGGKYFHIERQSAAQILGSAGVREGRKEVKTSMPLAEDQKTAFVRKLQAAYGADLYIDFVVDPSILGGVVVQVGDRIIDGSISGRLESIRERIK